MSSDPRQDRLTSKSPAYRRIQDRCEGCREPIPSWQPIQRARRDGFRHYRLCINCTASEARAGET